MKRNKCISCGNIITKSALFDPYFCRKCGFEVTGTKDRYAYLDSAE